MTKPLEEIYDVDARRDPLIEEYKRARNQLQKEDWRQGLSELEALAHRGSIMSILFVSDAMRDGWRYDQDLLGAETWYRVAVEYGSARGIFGLGLTHLLMKRFDEAISELETAIDQHYPPAYNALAGIYFRGDGVPVDQKRALELWRKGADLNHLPAKRNLVRQLIHGSYGLRGRIEGLLNLLPFAIEFGRAKSINAETDQMR